MSRATTWQDACSYAAMHGSGWLSAGIQACGMAFPCSVLQALAGYSIDVGEAAACRRRVLSFMQASAAAMSCMLQHLRG